MWASQGGVDIQVKNQVTTKKAERMDVWEATTMSTGP